MKCSSRILATFVLLLIVTILTSCTEEMDSGSTSATSAPSPDQPPQSQTVVPSQSALGGAKRAAENTRDRVADYQRKLEKDMEDN